MTLMLEPRLKDQLGSPMLLIVISNVALVPCVQPLK